MEGITFCQTLLKKFLLEVKIFVLDVVDLWDFDIDLQI